LDRSATEKKIFQKSQTSLKSDKDKGDFIWRRVSIYDNITVNFIYNEKVSDKSCREYQSARYKFSNLPLFVFENRAVYEIMWEKYCISGQTDLIGQYGARELHAGYLTLQAHTQNM
jgi:hypothetical protein